MVRRLERSGAETRRDASAGAGESSLSRRSTCRIRPQAQDSVELAQQVLVNRFHPDYYALQLGDHVLGGGFYATRLYRDLRQKAGYVYNVDNALSATETRATYIGDVWLRPGECFEGADCLVEKELAGDAHQ